MQTRKWIVWKNGDRKNARARTHMQTSATVHAHVSKSAHTNHFYGFLSKKKTFGCMIKWYDFMHICSSWDNVSQLWWQCSFISSTLPSSMPGRHNFHYLLLLFTMWISHHIKCTDRLTQTKTCWPIRFRRRKHTCNNFIELECMHWVRHEEVNIWRLFSHSGACIGFQMTYSWFPMIQISVPFHTFGEKKTNTNRMNSHENGELEILYACQNARFPCIVHWVNMRRKRRCW